MRCESIMGFVREADSLLGNYMTRGWTFGIIRCSFMFDRYEGFKPARLVRENLDGYAVHPVVPTPLEIDTDAITDDLQKWLVSPTTVLSFQLYPIPVVILELADVNKRIEIASAGLSATAICRLVMVEDMKSSFSPLDLIRNENHIVTITVMDTVEYARKQMGILANPIGNPLIAPDMQFNRPAYTSPDPQVSPMEPPYGPCNMNPHSWENSVYNHPSNAQPNIQGTGMTPMGHPAMYGTPPYQPLSPEPKHSADGSTDILSDMKAMEEAMNDYTANRVNGDEVQGQLPPLGTGAYAQPPRPRPQLDIKALQKSFYEMSNKQPDEPAADVFTTCLTEMPDEPSLEEVGMPDPFAEELTTENLDFEDSFGTPGELDFEETPTEKE